MQIAFLAWISIFETNAVNFSAFECDMNSDLSFYLHQAEGKNSISVWFNNFFDQFTTKIKNQKKAVFRLQMQNRYISAKIIYTKLGRRENTITFQGFESIF